jgi:hypothetical protein
MLYFDDNERRRLTREHAEQLTLEMRRARGLTPAEAGFPGWGRLAAELLARAERLRRNQGQHAPAYDA